MGPGDSNSQVSALQTFLAADSSIYPEGLVTGYYGSLTVAAVERYQCKNGIVCQGSPSTTGYGRVGPATLAKIQLQLGNGNGVSLPPVGFPTGTDLNAPILSQPTVVTTQTTAALHWSTSENARSHVMYSTAKPNLGIGGFDGLTSVYDSTFDTSSDVNISGLAPNTTYYYVLESDDASGNIQYGIGVGTTWYSFTTKP
jgi:peptidoglycan hydrolase-like protein with peptidoglycan-binding domain